MIAALSLDLDGTLWDVWPTVRRAEAVLQQWLRQHYPAIAARYDSDALRALNIECARENPRLDHDFSLRRAAGLSLAARRCGYGDRAESIGQQAFEVFLAERQKVVLFEHAQSMLQRVSQRLPVIALTNGNADIERVGIAPYFQFALSPSDGFDQKPHPGMFESALERLGIEAKQLLHVGDEPLSDLEGARRAGCRSVWFKPQADSATHCEAPTVQADHQIRCLSELPALVEALSA